MWFLGLWSKLHGLSEGLFECVKESNVVIFAAGCSNLGLFRWTELWLIFYFTWLLRFLSNQHLASSKVKLFRNSDEQRSFSLICPIHPKLLSFLLLTSILHCFLLPWCLSSFSSYLPFLPAILPSLAFFTFCPFWPYLVCCFSSCLCLCSMFWSKHR